MSEVIQIDREKWEKLKMLSDAIVRQREMLAECHTYENALGLQQLEEQRRALRATIGFAVIDGGKKEADVTFRLRH